MEINNNTGYPPAFIFSFLEKLKECPNMWDPKDKNYMKKTMKRSVMDEICLELQIEFPDVPNVTTDNLLTRFQNIRSHYQKLKRKYILSGSAGTPRRKWEYFDACSFLNEATPACKPVINYSLSPEQEAVITEDHKENTLVIELGAAGGDEPEPLPSPSHNTEDGPMEDLPEKRKTSAKKRKSYEDPVHAKIVESISALQNAWQSRQATSSQDPAAEAVNAFIKIIPESQSRIKLKFYKRLYALMSELTSEIENE